MRIILCLRQTRRQRLPPPRPLPTRLYSVVTAPPRREHLDVPCRSNGSITIDVYHAAAKTSPILVYLPPGPVLPGHAEEEEHIISCLSASSAATIARIHYRASSAHQYPTPFHDVLTGYDWIQQNLLRDAFDRPYLGRLGVCGQLVGGSLATMLALTECRVGEPRIAAAAVNNPIVDWVFPDELPAVSPSELPEPTGADDTALPADQDPATLLPVAKTSRKRPKPTTKKSPLTAWQAHGDNTMIPTPTLSAERDMLFRRPDDYFDRFASPIHFFRSPHAQMVCPEQDDIAASQQPDSDELLDMEVQFALNHYASFHGKTKTSPAVATLSRCRAYARNYPQAGTSLKLPAWHMTTGLQSPLADQTLELVKVIQRSLARQRLKSQSGRTRWLNVSEKTTYEQWAQEQVRLQTRPGVGLWSPQNDDTNWTIPVDEVGAWMKLRLEADLM
ncbi:alpha/beta-hydrolase [Plenodomus tracheiphilus IPT5]|uniref:Alpha/beta-hydrolase n=1 Tax=Plenodomus tracheiphilus IPT5 TaxID=1408161 RepID=A0A6A7AWJ4_9PLEO|nr:alpha/beta-hydrolase [Plenodomus tracheiphilus IPT5]